jgi:hypothetical protein
VRQIQALPEVAVSVGGGGGGEKGRVLFKFSCCMGHGVFYNGKSCLSNMHSKPQFRTPAIYLVQLSLFTGVFLYSLGFFRVLFSHVKKIKLTLRGGLDRCLSI